MTVQHSIMRLSLDPEARLLPGDGGVLLEARGRRGTMRCPPRVTSALLRLAEAHGVSKTVLADDFLESGEPSELLSLFGLLRSLDHGGLLRRTWIVESRPFCSYVAQVAERPFDDDVPLPSEPLRLSRFAFIRAEEGVPTVTSALGRAAVALHDPRAVTLVARLARPAGHDALEAEAPDLPPGTIAALLAMLGNADCLVSAEATEASTAAAGWWAFHDALFHMRSRRGRHAAPYGGTYPHAGATPPPLVRAARAGATSIPLSRPDLEALRRKDPPLIDAMERRRSTRAYAERPPNIEHLGEFLFRSARYQRVLKGDDTDFALRPAPAGGALHELEIYPVVVACEGLAAGLYRYLPAEHALESVARPTPRFERLVEDMRQTVQASAPPPVCLVITARCHRVFWKYESMAYALILKNLGALYATMYLAADAAGLAPCALGGGDSELFAALAGLDPLDEPAVGEFALGLREPA